MVLVQPGERIKTHARDSKGKNAHVNRSGWLCLYGYMVKWACIRQFLHIYNGILAISVI
jgi:hypothetical protein